MEGFVVILGMCVAFVPAIIFSHYVISKASRTTKFDAHLEIVKDKKGRIGVLVAYAERILFGVVVTSMGVVLSEYFKNDRAIEILIISLICYIIVKFFDEKNEK